MTAGDRQLPIDVNVVIIGETGSGKSTLINYFTNLFHNGTLTNLNIAIPTRYLQMNMSALMPEPHEDAFDDVTRRQTSQCTKYQFRVQQVRFNFYDTPGISETDARSSDDHDLERIFQCIQSIEQLAALVFVVNGSQPRLTVNIKTVLERLHKRMPDVFYTNLIVLFTNCTSHTVNFDSMKFSKRVPIFYMQNSAFSSDPQTWSQHIHEMLQRDWQRSMETMNEFITRLLLLTPISTHCLADASNDRNSIRSILHAGRLIIMQLEQIEDELTALQEAAGASSANIEEYRTENGTQAKTIEVNEITTTPYHNTLCLQCNTVCHERCSLTETTYTGEHVFRRCTVMDNGRCTHCPGRCSYAMHYHDRRLIRSVSRTIKYALSSSSSKGTDAEQGKAACRGKCQTVQERKHLLEQRLQEQVNKVQEACRRVQTSCSGFNVAEELCTFIRLLRSDMMTISSKSVSQKMTEIIVQLESLANGRSTTLDQSSHSKRNKRVQQKNNPPIGVTSSLEQTSICSNPRNYAEYTTEKLINLTRQAIEKHVLITNELHRRCEGISMGYLSPTELSTVCEYYSAIGLLNFDQLLSLHAQLQSEVQQLTDANPAEILSVPIDKLLHLTAIKLRLQNCAI